jgi:hypothetical protein
MGLTDQQHVQRGIRAKEILEDDLFREMADTAFARITEEWKDAGSVEVRERLHSEQAALRRLINEFRGLEANGKIAKEAQRLAEKKKKEI